MLPTHLPTFTPPTAITVKYVASDGAVVTLPYCPSVLPPHGRHRLVEMLRTGQSSLRCASIAFGYILMVFSVIFLIASNVLRATRAEMCEDFYRLFKLGSVFQDKMMCVEWDITFLLMGTMNMILIYAAKERKTHFLCWWMVFAVACAAQAALVGLFVESYSFFLWNAGDGPELTTRIHVFLLCLGSLAVLHIFALFVVNKYRRQLLEVRRVTGIPNATAEIDPQAFM